MHDEISIKAEKFLFRPRLSDARASYKEFAAFSFTPCGFSTAGLWGRIPSVIYTAQQSSDPAEQKIECKLGDGGADWENIFLPFRCWIWGTLGEVAHNPHAAALKVALINVKTWQRPNPFE